MRWLLPVLLVSSIARAQEPIRCEPVASAFRCPGDLICNQDRFCVPLPRTGDERHPVAMRNTGIVLTTIGVGLLSTAVYFFAKSLHCGPIIQWPYRSLDDNCGDGYLSLAGSIAFFGVGIPLWSVGQHHLNQDARRAQLFITPVDGGAVAGVRVVSF